MVCCILYLQQNTMHPIYNYDTVRDVLDEALAGINVSLHDLEVENFQGFSILETETGDADIRYKSFTFNKNSGQEYTWTIAVMRKDDYTYGVFSSSSFDTLYRLVTDLEIHVASSSLSNLQSIGYYHNEGLTLNPIVLD